MKLITSEDILFDISQDHNIHYSGWELDAVRYIGRCLEIMRIPVNMVTYKSMLKVVDFKARMPCKLENLVSIANSKGEKIYFTDSQYFNDVSNGVRVFKNDSRTILKYGYKINNNFIQLAFNDDCIYVTFEAFPVTKGSNCKYYPMIPDGGLTKEAIRWYILMRFAERRIAMSVDYNICFSQWNNLYPQAQNEWKLRTEDERLSFARMWTRNIVDLNLADRFFVEDITQETI